MKKIFFHIVMFLMLTGLVENRYAQVSVQLEVFPLPEVDLGSLIINDNIGGGQRILQVAINPAGVDVVLDFVISWKKPNESSFQPIIWATTKPFKSRTFTNDEISSLTDIEIETSDTDSDLLDELRKLGSPTGAFMFEVTVSSPDGSFNPDTDSKIIEFSNPSQSFEILSPQSNSIENIGSVVASWSPVSDATYELRANVRQNEDDSFEEALESGNPLIDDVDVGNLTTVNLRQYLAREWLPGQEIVFQVTAVIPRPGTPERYPSQIVNFYIEDPVSNQGRRSPEQILGDLTNSIITYYNDESRRNPDDDSYNDFMASAQGFLTRLQNGTVTFSEIKRIADETGAVISEAEFRAVLNYLQANPDKVLSIKFITN